ncbi:MAG: chorismate mutase, partial [Lachnospiraceae bacterium]|nr:chorismate mutase [Lachnospiraceae bacterium]
MPDRENKIDILRDRIEKIDGEMAGLFEQRMACAAEIAAYKREKGLPILDKGREKILIERNTQKISNREYEPYYREFLTGMLDISKKYQHRLSEGLRVAYSGIEGSFASICAGRIFPEASRIPYKCFADAYNAVRSGECDLAVLPIENSYAGEVGQVADLMFDGDLFINGVYELPVSQCLLGVPGATADTIKTVISHPQALDQC